jgi:hypothetical protein
VHPRKTQQEQTLWGAAIGKPLYRFSVWGGEGRNQSGVTARLGPFGQFQGPFIEVWNAKGARTFTFRDRYHIEGHLEYFNVLNSNAAVATSYLTSTFGAVTGIVSPRVLRFGAVFSF